MTAVPKQLRAGLGAVASVLVSALALWFLYRVVAGLSPSDVVAAVRSMPILALAVSIVLAICHFSLLTMFDAVALRYLDVPLPYRCAALTSFIARAVGQNAGVATLSATKVRQRMYSQSGLSASEVTRLVYFIAVTGALGASVTAGLALIMLPTDHGPLPEELLAVFALAGVALLVLPVTYLASTFVRRKPVGIAGWQITLPSPKIALAQLALSCAGVLFAAATFYVLLANVTSVGFPYFVLAYFLAMAAGRLSAAPGGIGAFEAVLFLALPQVPPEGLLACIVIHRCIAYLAPLVIASVAIFRGSGRLQGRLMQGYPAQIVDRLSCIKPQTVGTLVFLAGVVLLASIVIPPPELQRALITGYFPLPLLEILPVLGGAVGAALLFCSRGLFGRRYTAYLGAVTGLLAAVIVTLFTGFAYIGAIVTGLAVLVLYVNRQHFYRRGPFVHERFTARWLAAIAIGIGLALWVFLTVHRHFDDWSGAWLHFATDASAPRSLRAVAAAVLLAVVFLLWVLVSKRPKSSLPENLPEDPQVILPVLQASGRATANLALLGDKRLLWSNDSQALLMYQVSGDSWVAHGDPLGSTERHEEVIRAFVNEAERNYGSPVFFQVGEEQLPLYIDLGLAVTKVGEEARVRLRGFSLQESHNAELSYTVSQIRQHGFEFDIVPQAEVATIMADLRSVSERWIADKYATERRFSLGSFSAEYLANFDCAVVRIDGTLVAFANIWTAPAGQELALDLLRYSQMAPKGIMDFVYAELMSWGREQGYKWCSLGMAPLTRTGQHPLAPLWQKLDMVICSHVDNFYAPDVLRGYKDKFKPVWQPRYVAAPADLLQLPNVLLDTSRMISGGVAGMFARS